MTISKQSKFLDNTIISSYKDCPRKYQIRHVLHWRRTGIAAPLAFGGAWHAAMDAVWKVAQGETQAQTRLIAQVAFEAKWQEEGLDVNLDIEQIDRMMPRTPMVANAMLAGYISERWTMLQNAEIVAIEQPFAVPMPGTTDTWYVGRLDKVVNYGGQRLVIEHKTTTAYGKATGFLNSFTEGWDSDSQVKGYEFGGSMYFGTDQVWVDAALVHKTVHSAFRFIPVAHQKPILLEFIRDTRNWVSRIHADAEANYFPKNENSCMGKFGPCTYLDICRTIPEPEKLEAPPVGYVVEQWLPFDVLQLDKLIQGDKDGQTNTDSNNTPA